MRCAPPRGKRIRNSNAKTEGKRASEKKRQAEIKEDGD